MIYNFTNKTQIWNKEAFGNIFKEKKERWLD